MSQIKMIVSNYKIVLLDIWGVLSDGLNAFPGGLDLIKELQTLSVILLSNTTHLAPKIKSMLYSQGYSEQYFSRVITSGMMLQHYVTKNYHPTQDKYYYIGDSKQHNLISSLGYPLAQNIREADFIVLTTPDDTVDTDNLFAQALELQIPLLCVNPDISIQRISGETIYCAGSLARSYQQMGGEVIYLGKPIPHFYQFALSNIKFKKEDVLCIGDGLETDIYGAHNMGFDSMLINKIMPPDSLIKPTYIIAWDNNNSLYYRV